MSAPEFLSIRYGIPPGSMGSLQLSGVDRHMGRFDVPEHWQRDVRYFFGLADDEPQSRSGRCITGSGRGQPAFCSFLRCQPESLQISVTRGDC
jgi:hypothetical protein